MAACVALAWLPDADALPLALGAPDRGIFGHRGFTHTPLFAAAVGLAVAAYWLARRRPGSVRLGVLATLLVSSHGLLDAIAQEGRGIMFLWPLSTERFHLPWRPIPDAPLGLAFFSRIGLAHLAIELLLFLPFTLYAIGPKLGWSRIRAWASGTAAPRAIRLWARSRPAAGA
jgi:inner membrane protein